jgi:PTH1 family peptidyl-tRNA hydrolase
VLGKWTDDELSRLPEVLAKAAEATVAFGTIGLARTMNQFNG